MQRLLLALLALAGCSDPGGGSPGVVRLAVQPLAPEPRSREAVAAGTVDWPAEAAAISVEGASLQLVGTAPGASGPVLRLGPPAGAEVFPAVVRVRLSGTFDPSRFNRLEIPADSAEDAYVHCVLLAGGEALLGSANRARISPRTSRKGPERVVLDLPSHGRFARAADALELVFDNVHTPIRLGSVELFQLPPWAWLPAAEDGFGMVAIGTDERCAVGVSTARALEATAVVPKDAELRCSVAIPLALRGGGGRPTFRVEIRGERGKPLVEEVAVESSARKPTGWTEVNLPLRRFGGQTVQASFTFSMEGAGREGVCALSQPRIASASPAPRTVLLVTSDTHRADAVGAMGDASGARTPAIDALAGRGVLFEDCWSSTNVTLPSHVAIMTATSPRDTGVLDNHVRLSDDARTLAESFRDQGFLAYAVVSAPHLGDAASGLGQGFDRLSAPTSTSKRRSQESIQQLLAWIDDAQGQDLFLWLHTFDAHTPYEPPPEFESRYWPAGRDPADPALPEPVVPKNFRVYLPEGVRDLEYMTARYKGEVSYLDAQLAHLFEVPRVKAGVIALTADHGESLGEHGIYWDHAGLYTQSIHVPLILAWPGAPAGKRVQGPVTQLDLAQTLLALAGLADPELPGASLLAAEPNARAPRFTVASGADRASVTRDRWHLIVALRPYLVTEGAEQKFHPRHHVELFDLTKDPRCERDLAREELARARELRTLLCQWLASAQPRGWASRARTGPELAAHLAQLGYAASAGAAEVPALDPDCTCEECAPFAPAR